MRASRSRSLSFSPFWAINAEIYQSHDFRINYIFKRMALKWYLFHERVTVLTSMLQYAVNEPVMNLVYANNGPVADMLSLVRN